VQFRSGDGLFGDLHFNPKHALSEQLVWDAEHAPQNVGMSHNVLARTTRSGDETVVEAITKVQSIDLVADPATTSGLYEHVKGQEPLKGYPVESQEPETGALTPDAGSKLLTLDSLTLEEFRLHRPDLIREIENTYEAQLVEANRRLEELAAREEVSRRRERIVQLLQENNLPLPPGDSLADSRLVTPHFIETLMQAADEQIVRRLVEERAELIRTASRWSRSRPSADRRPRSRDQVGLASSAGGTAVRNAAEFAAAVRGR
jgi:hypothetical protein